MKKFLILTTVLLACTSLTYGQQDTPYPQRTPNPLYPGDQTEDAVRRSEDLKRRSDALRMTQNLPPEVPDAQRKEFAATIEPLYRESTEEERAFMAVSDEDKAGYERFAGKKDSGLVLLVEDRGCADNAKVVSASVDCSRYSMPGAGSGYSFRFGDYRMHHIADIVFKKGNFEALGVLNHGIIVDLGDVPFESITEKSDGVAYLAKIKPSKDFQEAAVLADKLTKGIKENGRTYASILPVKENSTYVIRSIAYEGEALRKVAGIVYNELDLDKRRDVLIAFRVLRLADGSATIVWKELDDSKAPKLKPDKK
ncbi:MAG: hypothetical protein IPM63_18365 [Acidobacteriota bacterium]|nr:MAG: hypothetical protein IPM63_18365 [Acidobacteriota bacterium]